MAGGVGTPYLMAPVPAGRLSTPIGSTNPLPQTRSVTSAAGGKALNSPKSNTKKRDRMEDLRKCWQKPISKICCLITTLLMLAGLVVGFVLTEALLLPNHLQFSWLAPDLFRGGQDSPNQIQMDVIHNDQVRFELSGNMPFRGNFISIMNFKTVCQKKFNLICRFLE